MKEKRAIYIAGDYMISSLGFSTAENMEAMRAGKTGIREIEDPGLYDAALPLARICPERWRDKSRAAGLENYPPLEQLFILSIGEVLHQTGIDIRQPECGLILATTKGNIDRLGFPSAYLGKMAQHLADYFSCSEPVVISNACISGLSALIVASRWIESGKYKHVIVAGGDLLSRFVVTGFQSFRSVSARPCRPYDSQRDGLTLGEACGCIALTADPAVVKALPAIVVEGGAITNDANHISGPSRTGEGLYRAIRSAMEEAGVSASDISFVNAHGTATLYNDEMEAKALDGAGLAEVPLNSLKAYWGHTLGAAGLIESIACFEQLRKGVVFGTRGYETSGVSLALSLSGEHRSQPMKRCVKTASGFGGCNAAVVFAIGEQVRKAGEYREVEMKTLRTCRIADGKVEVDGKIQFTSEGDFGEFIRSAYKKLGSPNMKFYKMDDLCKLGYVTAEWLLNGIDVEGHTTGIILSNAASSLDTDRKHQDIINRLGDSGASPAVFVYTLPNVVMGEICIRHKIQAENTFFVRPTKSMEFLKEYVCCLMQKNKLKTAIYGWCELDGQNYEADLYLLTI